MSNRNPKKIRNEFLKTLITMVSAAFGLVAALAWNTAISEIIKKYLKPGSGIYSWIFYALVVTVIAVLVGFYLGRLASRIKKEESLDEAQDKEKEKK